MYINMYIQYYIRKIIVKEFYNKRRNIYHKKVFMKSIGYTSKEI